MPTQRSRQLEGDCSAHAVAEECEGMIQIRRDGSLDRLYKRGHTLEWLLVDSRFAAGQSDRAHRNSRQERSNPRPVGEGACAGIREAKQPRFTRLALDIREPGFLVQSQRQQFPLLWRE